MAAGMFATAMTRCLCSAGATFRTAWPETTDGEAAGSPIVPDHRPWHGSFIGRGCGWARALVFLEMPSSRRVGVWSLGGSNSVPPKFGRPRPAAPSFIDVTASIPPSFLSASTRISVAYRIVSSLRPGASRRRARPTAFTLGNPTCQPFGRAGVARVVEQIRSTMVDSLSGTGIARARQSGPNWSRKCR